MMKAHYGTNQSVYNFLKCAEWPLIDAIPCRRSGCGW